MKLLLALLVCILSSVSGFGVRPRLNSERQRSCVAMLFDGPLDTPEFAILAMATLVPSLAFVKFIGDASDKSRGSLSNETQERFRRSMMEQPGANLALPTSEEEALKKAIAKAYIQDKDVDVAVLEQKLRKRAEWRKQMMAEQKANAGKSSEPDVDGDGW